MPDLENNQTEPLGIEPPVAEATETTNPAGDDEGSVFDDMSNQIIAESGVEAPPEDGSEPPVDEGDEQVAEQVPEQPVVEEKPVDYKAQHAALQKKYQLFLEKTKGFLPRPQYNALKAEVDTLAKSGTSPDGTLSEDNQFVGVENLYDMSPAQLQNMIASTVMGTLNKAEIARQQQEAQTRFETEKAECDKAFDVFIHETTEQGEKKQIYSEAELKEAANTVYNRYGINPNQPGEYMRFTNLMFDQLEKITLKKAISSEVGKKQIDAIDKARNLALTKQPAGASAPPGKTKTENDRTLDMIKRAGPKAKVSELFGT